MIRNDRAPEEVIALALMFNMTTADLNALAKQLRTTSERLATKRGIHLSDTENQTLLWLANMLPGMKSKNARKAPTIDADDLPASTVQPNP